MIEMYHLRQLCAIAEYGTLSGAAEHLYLSQPALSRTMKRLEKILGVSLFERRKNKITLNENGKLAVEYAKKVLEDADLFVERVREFDESRHTISVCCCAPAPLWILVPLLSELFPDTKINSEMKYHDNFLSELSDDKHNIIVTPEPVHDDTVYSFKMFDEQLYLSVPPAHRLADYREVTLSDLEGETMLLYNELGFWNGIKERMPQTKFILQHELHSMNELIKLSALPAFSTNLTIKNGSNRVNIPVRDNKASATYYCCWKKSDFNRFKMLEQSLTEKIQELRHHNY